MTTYLALYGKYIHSTGLTGRVFTYTAMQLINQVPINPRIRTYLSINEFNQNIQSIKLEVLGLID